MRPEAGTAWRTQAESRTPASYPNAVSERVLRAGVTARSLTGLHTLDLERCSGLTLPEPRSVGALTGLHKPRSGRVTLVRPLWWVGGGGGCTSRRRKGCRASRREQPPPYERGRQHRFAIAECHVTRRRGPRNCLCGSCLQQAIGLCVHA